MNKGILDSKVTVTEIDSSMLKYKYDQEEGSEVLFSNHTHYLILCKPFGLTVIIPNTCCEINKMIEEKAEDDKFVEFAAGFILHEFGLSYILKKVECALSTSHERGYLQGRSAVQNEIKQALGITEQF